MSLAKIFTSHQGALLKITRSFPEHSSAKRSRCLFFFLNGLPTSYQEIGANAKAAHSLAFFRKSESCEPGKGAPLLVFF